MRPFVLLLALSLPFAAFPQSPARGESLGWMTGTWMEEKDGARVVESWIGPANGLMVAANLSTWPGGRKFFEHLRIADTAQGISYFASPGGRPATEVRLKSLEGQRVVFETPEKEYPRRILYWRDGDALLARIEGDNGKSEQWRFTRR